MSAVTHTPASATSTANLRARVDATTLAAAAVGTLTFVHLLYYAPRVVDDLFISLRYAENLVHGRGLVYNAGERVEGFSSPAWVFLQAIGLALGCEGVTFTKALGVTSLIALHVGLHRLTREVFGVRGPLALLPNLFLALDGNVTQWAILGLETPALLAAIPWSIVCLRRAAAPDGTRGQRAAAATVLVLLATVRPESPAWAATVVGCEAIAHDGAHFRRVARAAWPAALACVLLLFLRRAYYGDWVANTYYVKGHDTHFELARLQPLIRHGCAPIEAAFVLFGLLFLAAAAWVRRRAAAPLIALGVLAFTASVETDWMPSLRHLLPVRVLAGVGWAFVADRIVQRWSRAPRVVIAGAFAWTLGAGLAVARVESRSTMDPFGDGKWAHPKTLEKWRDSLLALRRIEPPHVAAMGDFEMGMVTQNYRLFEASAQPLESSWYVGRDIGKVGYYVDAKVFDTAGLFTPAVVDDASWRASRAVGPELVSAAFRHKPVAAELYDGWAHALGREKWRLHDYRILNGDADAPIDVVAVTETPTPEEILSRYERSLAKFPRLFHLATLHGEHVGAAMEKRVRIVRGIVDDLHAMPAPPADASSLGVTLDGGAALTRGCALSSNRAHPGDVVRLHCFWDVVTATRKPWQVFVHVVDASGTLRFQADHAPASGLSPAWGWRAGSRVHDVVRVTIPKDVPAGTYGIRWGWYTSVRASVSGAGVTPDGRIVGPELVVER